MTPQGHARANARRCARAAARAAAAALVAAALAAACTSAPIAPDTPRAVDAQPIAPWEIHEACADIVAGDRIDFRFDATAAVDFDLYYREGIAVVIPLSRTDVTADAGIFEVEIPGHYCLAWKAGPGGAYVSYHLIVHTHAR